MIYWKEECKKLASANAKVVVVDGYDQEGVPQFVIFDVWSAIGSKSGRNSYWNVLIGAELSDGCCCVTYPHMLAYNDGKKVEVEKLEQYHPAWKLSEEGERKLELARSITMTVIRSEFTQIPSVDIFPMSDQEREILKDRFLNKM